MDKSNIKLEKIEKYNINIYQDTEHFKFGIDAFCLAHFVNYQKNKKVRYIDMCAGTGIVGILTSKIQGLETVTFIEKNEYAANICQANIEKNDIKADLLIEDVTKLDQVLELDKYDLITINPPYMKQNSGLNTKTNLKDMAKIEQSIDFLDQVFRVSFRLLKDKGQLYMINRVERLVDIFNFSRKNRMEPKTIQYVRNKGSKKASLVMIKFVKNGSQFLQCLDDYNI